MKYGLTTLALVLIAGTAWALSDFVVPKTWNYKITVELQTPEGMKSGSAIRQVQAIRELSGPLHLGGGVIRYNVAGEAVIIDLGSKGILFYPLDWDSNSLVRNNFPTEIKGQWERAEYYSSLPAGKSSSQAGWQSFLWLDTSDTSKNLQRLDSTDFSKVLGSEYRLVKSTIEITDEDVTSKIEPYLKQIKGRMGNYFRKLFINEKW